MDTQVFNKKLNKISALADNGNADGHFSSLERDLLLSYIRELYEIVLDGKSTVIKSVAHTPVQTTKEEVIPAKADTPAVQTYEQTPEPIPAKVEMVTEPDVIQSIIEKEEVMIPAPVVKNVITQTTASKIQNPDALAEMFAEEKINDLSDKLASSAINDLTKSMGINERIFTQQELFGNNQQVFNETLQRLNICQNFGEAKQYLLENVISTYDWTSENKVKKATTFIKFVKRKFA
jgi:hypothetical protein